jgi:hypothetical protein
MPAISLLIKEKVFERDGEVNGGQWSSGNSSFLSLGDRHFPLILWP